MQKEFWSCLTSADSVMQYTRVQPGTHVEMTAKRSTLMCNVSHCQNCLYNIERLDLDVAWDLLIVFVPGLLLPLARAPTSPTPVPIYY